MTKCTDFAKYIWEATHEVQNFDTRNRACIMHPTGYKNTLEIVLVLDIVSVDVF